MNALLKMDFFKKIGFPTKESGVEFIKQNPKLNKAIEEKVDEIEETKYQIIDIIRDEIFPKYNLQKELFLVQVKGKRNEKIAHKKDIQKQVLKEELRAELLEEIKYEEQLEKKMRLTKKYPKAYPNIDEDFIQRLPDLSNIFNQIIKKIDNQDIDIDNIIVVEKQKIQVEKALEMLKKAMLIIEKLN